MGDSDGGKKRNGISRSLKRFFGVGDFGFSFMTNIETYYFTYFLTNIAEFSLPVVTMITTIASVVDAALSWIYGVILDTFKPMKWGRYRSWLVVIPWLVPFLYAFQFIRVGSGTAAVVIIIIATITSHIAWNIPFVANISMINMASKTPEDRMALSSSRAIWQSLGRVFYSYVGPAVVSVLAGIVGEKNSYGATAFVFAALMAAGYFAHFKMFEGYEETGAQEIERMQRERAQRKARGRQEKESGLLKCLTTNPYLLGLTVADLTKYIYSFVASGIRSLLFHLCCAQQGSDCNLYPYLQPSWSRCFLSFKSSRQKVFCQKHRHLRLSCHGSCACTGIPLLSSAMGGYPSGEPCAVLLYHDKRMRTCPLCGLCHLQ